MEYGSSIYLTKENSFQTQDSWIPVTPTKPKQTNQSAPKQWLNSGAYSNGQENSCENTVGASNSKPGTAMHFNSTAFADREQNLNSWKVATAAQTQVSSLNTYVEALRNAAAQWNKMPYANPLSSTDAMAAASAMHRGRNATTLRSPISYIQTDGSSNQQQLRMNQALMPESNSSSNNRSCCPPQMTQYGFPVPYHTTYNCGFHKKAIADSVTNGTISFQPAPVSPVWGTRVQDNQTVQLTCLSADERASHEKESLTPCVSVTALPKGSVEPYNNQGMLQPVNMLLPAVLPTQMKETYNPSNKEVLCENSLAAALSTPVKENHNPDKGEDQCIDLNKTPQQKPKIKRHRPKVIREDKPKRTPKPVTPNQTISTENPLKKRKYVRRAGPKASITPSENAHEAVDSYDGTGVRSCKRSLNFNLEGKTEGGQPSTTQVHWGKPNRSTSDKFGDASCTRALNLNAETQYFNQYGGISLCFGSKSTLEVAQGLEVVVGNLPAGIAFDLNHSKTQAQDDRISLPGKANSCQTIAKEEPSMEHMKSLAVKRRSMGSIGPCINIHDKGHPHMHQNVHTNDTECRINPSEASRDNLLSIEPPKLQNGLQLINENQYNSNSRLHVLLGKSNNIKRGSKREYNFTVNDTHLHPVNLYATHSIPMQASQQRIIQYNEYYGKSGAQDIHFHENYKKMKTDTRNELTSNMMLPVTVRVNSGSQPTAASVSEVIANQLALQISGGRSMPLCNLMEGNNKPQNGASYKVPDVHSQSMAGKHNRTVPNISREVFSRLNAQREIYLNEPQAPNGMGLGNIEKAMNGRMNRPVQMNELASLTAAAVTCDRLPTTPVKTVLTYNDRQVSNIFCRPQARMKTLVADNYGKLRKKDNTEEVVYLAHHMPSNTSQVHLQEHNAPVYVYHQSRMESRVTTPVQKPIGPTTSSSNHSQPRISQTVPINFIYDYQSSSNTQQTLCASFPFQVIAPCTDPVDEIVQRFKSLNFDDGSKIITAQAKSALVPYGGDGKMVPYKGLFDPTKKRQPRPKVNLDSETDRVWKLLMWKEGNDGTEGTDAEKQKWWEEERHVFRGRADSFIARMHLVQGDRRFSPWKGSVVDSVVGVFLTQNVSDQLSSSAFMALAAKFPLQSRSTEHNGQGKNSSAEEQDVSILETDDSISRQSKILNQKVYDRESMRIQEVDHLEVKEIASSNESFGSNMAACTEEYLKSVEDRKATEDVVPSQVSVISSQNSTESIVQAADTVGPSSESNSEVENLIKRFECDDFDSSTTFMDLLKMEGTKMFNDFYVNGNECIPAIENFYVATNQLKGAGYGKRISYDGEDHPKVSSPSNSNTSTHCLQTQQEYKGIPSIHSNGYHLHIGPRSDPAQLESMEASGEKNGSYLPSAASRITEIKDDCFTGKMKNAAAEYKIDNALQRNPCFNAQTTLKGYSSIPLTKHSLHPPPTSDAIPNTHFDVAECSNLVDKQTVKVRNVAEPIRKDEVYNSKNVHTRPTKNDLKGKRGMSRADKKRVFDWDSLRKNAFLNAPKRESSINTMDSVDWEAVRRADVSEISNAIRERGMNNMLSERIKDFLNRLVKEHGSINLEWLRDVPPDKAKDYLLSIRGLGLKSTECVRLLTLHHLAFPVDTNVGRMCVRLGWVPLQPLPESLQLHLLELYPQLETVQKYLWPRLCTLDQRTLYELHYQMITFGKVFCTKHKPNCNACPMRGECKHFASAFASARLALPGPEEKRLVASAVPSTTEHGKLVINPMPLPQPENPHLQAGSRTIQCEPIIEEPVTPEPEYIDTLERAIEDAFWMDDPDEIPTIKLNFEEFTQNVQNYIQGNAELQDDDMSKALVALTQEAASIPMPKLKNTSRLRTEHQVYELPDSHPLLAKLDRREPDDPCPYLLAIWTPGETAQSIRPPEKLCNSQKSGNLCSKKTCFACNSIREENAQTVRGTLLIPCRTAMRGSFPLNGTYFQVNEVFADDESSIHPIDVPRAWIWNLPRRTVYFGTSISTIFKGLTTEGIQQCFWRGFICVRGFDQKTQAPRPLTARLHFPASKLVRTKKTLAESEQA